MSDQTTDPKLQAISTKFRQQQELGTLTTNFLRYYYDVSQLLHHPIVQKFIGTEDYHTRKTVRFRQDDNLNISENEAFILSDKDTRDLYIAEFNKTADLYYEGQPSFDEIIANIQSHIDNVMNKPSVY